jgi:putative cell wall-binding protein
MKHRFRTHGRWLALVAIVGASTVGLAPAAHAYQGNPPPGDAEPAIDVVNCTAAGAGSVSPDPIDIPTITFGVAGQSAGCWAIQPDPGQAWENGDQVVIAVDDNDADAAGAPTSDPLATSPGNVVFSSAPTVKLGSQTLTNVTLLNGGQRLRVTVTGLSSPTFADMVISNVKYDVGFGPGSADDTQFGPVHVLATLNAGSPGIDVGGLTGLFLGQASNAYVSNVSMTANDPEVGIDINAVSTTAPISDITIKEANSSALGSGPNKSICVDLTALGPNPDTVDFDTANVSKVSGDATALGITVAANTLEITFTTPSPRTAANTFKISGIKVDPTTTGRILAVASDCDATQYSPATTLGAVLAQKRVGGSDRFQTARRIAQEIVGTGSAEAAVIARADDFADALAASGLSGKAAQDTGKPVPVLLTETNAIPSATLNALSNLGVHTVYIVGGTQAVSQAVENQLRNTPSPGSGVFCPGSDTTECLRVRRIAGQDRYGTAREIADFIGTPGTVDLDETDGLATADALKTAFLARGDVFADALAVGPLAYQGTNGTACIVGLVGCGDGKAMPILLTTPNALSPAAAAALIDNGVKQVVIAGGTTAVSQAVEDAVKDMGINVVRVAGTNRQHTAALVAGMALGSSFAWPTLTVGGGSLALARGDNFPDALAGGPLGGEFFAPIVLTENPGTLGVFTTGFLDLTSAVLFRFPFVLGQTAAVSGAAAAAMRAALSGTTLPQ